jgi:hypothetical protein
MNRFGLKSCHGNLVSDAQSLMKGCMVHFLSSAQRINKNYAIVGRDDNGAFYKFIKSVVQEPMLEAFTAAMEILQATKSLFY